MTEYIVGKIEPKRIADLRAAVGWNRMENELSRPELTNLFEIGCYERERLIGYLAVVSNCVTDAYIQDVMVHPKYQRQGIGSELMRQAISRLRRMNIYMISVIYGEESLRSFYERSGFQTMLCGQMQTREG